MISNDTLAALAQDIPTVQDLPGWPADFLLFAGCGLSAIAMLLHVVGRTREMFRPNGIPSEMSTLTLVATAVGPICALILILRLS